MFNYKLSQKLLTLLGVIGFGLLIAPSFGLRSQAQSNAPPTTSLNSQVASEQSQSQAEFEPPNQGAPRRTADGGARGCQEDTLLAVTPLIPNDHGATTISEYPTFLWYLNAQTQTQVKALNLVLISHNGQEIYSATDLPVNESGIISVQVPRDQIPLEKDTWYEWFLQVQLKKDRESNITECYVSAWIKRQSLTPEQQQELDSLTTAEERLHFYQQHDILYDILATLDELRRENPNDETLHEQWRQALDSIQLSHFADQPPAEITPIARDTDEFPNP
jgi:hypothetical protein